jgi:hypothetical protein
MTVLGKTIVEVNSFEKCTKVQEFGKENNEPKCSHEDIMF